MRSLDAFALNGGSFAVSIPLLLSHFSWPVLGVAIRAIDIILQ